MDGIADVIALDGMCLVALVVRLPAGTGCPDDACEAVGTDLVHDGLEVVVQRLCVFFVLGVLQVHRLVGKFDADMSCMLLHETLLREDVPNGRQILLVVVAHLQVARTDTRGAYHDVHTVLHRLLCKVQVEGIQEMRQTLRVELADVCLATGVSSLACRTCIHITVVGIVRPGRVEVQTEDRTLRLLQSREDLFEIVQALLRTGIVVVGVVRPGRTPPPAVEIHIRRVHHTVQHHLVPLRIHQPLPFHMERGQYFRFWYRFRVRQLWIGVDDDTIVNNICCTRSHYSDEENEDK